MQVELAGMQDITVPVNLPPIASRHTVALSCFERSLSLSRKSASVELRTCSAPKSFNILTYSSFLTILIKGIPSC